jgi:hypothetical protein
MFGLIFSVGLSIILNALNFEILAPLQVIFIADMGKQVIMDEVVTDEIESIVDDLFSDMGIFD